MEDEKNEQWAVVELMGHARTAGRISRPGDMGGLLRVDVPVDATFRTEYYGMASIYSVKLVSEEIARAYAERQPEAVEYDAPIVTKAQYTQMQERAESALSNARRQIDELQRRLTAVNALPAGDSEYPEGRD